MAYLRSAARWIGNTAEEIARLMHRRFGSLRLPNFRNYPDLDRFLYFAIYFRNSRRQLTFNIAYVFIINLRLYNLTNCKRMRNIET